MFQAITAATRSATSARASMATALVHAMSSNHIALVDAHCHIHDARFCGDGTFDVDSQSTRTRTCSLDALRPVLQRAIAANVTRIVTCACHRADWDALETLLAHWVNVVSEPDQGVTAEMSRTDNSSTSSDDNGASIHLTPSFGVHPWWANEAQGDYLSRLRAKLTQHPHASIGEIGLCKSSRGQAVATSVQETAFREQLELATELSRTCVIHCVGRYGRLLELLLATMQTQQTLPPRIVLHSYAGGAALVSSFVALERKAPGTRVFFSLNAKQLSDARSDKATASCAAIPLRSLLLETDAPDQVPDAAVVREAGSQDEDIANRLNEPALVAVAYTRAAAIRQLSLADLAAAVHENAMVAFGAVQ